MSLLTLPNEVTFLIARFLMERPIGCRRRVSRHLSALARSNRHLHTLLTPEMIRITSPLKILIWAILHCRQDIITLAINHGADPNAPLRDTRCFIPKSVYAHKGTPVEIASSLHFPPGDPITHSRKFSTIKTLLQAGGKPTIMSLTDAVCRNDLNLLELCLPYITDINERVKCTGSTLLQIAGVSGYVRVVALLLAAGAAVNSTGSPDSPGYYPPLWNLCSAPVSVLRLLLDAGADAAWEHGGVSIVAHLQLTRGTWDDIEGIIDLLVWHGSRPQRGEEAIALWQAPVWEIWTMGEGTEVVERVLGTGGITGGGGY